MKSSYVALIIAVCAIVGVVGLYLSGGSGTAATTAGGDDEFLESVREKASTIVGPDMAGEGIVPGTSGNPDLVPRIRVPEEIFLEGIPAGEPYVTHIDVYNDGEAPLIIETVTTECGCTQGEMVKNVIQGGESEKMKITILPEYILNLEIRRSLSIVSNDPINRVLELPVQSKLDADLAIEPRAVVFGDASEGVAETAVVRMWQTKDVELELKSVYVEGEDSSYFATSFEEVPESEWREPGKREYDITITMLGIAPPKGYSPTAMCSLSIPSQPILEIPIRAYVRYFADVDTTPGESINVLSKGESVPVAKIDATRPFTVDLSNMTLPEGLSLELTGEAEDLNRELVLHVADDIATGNYQLHGVYDIIDVAGKTDPKHQITRATFLVE